MVDIAKPRQFMVIKYLTYYYSKIPSLKSFILNTKYNISIHISLVNKFIKLSESVIFIYIFKIYHITVKMDLIMK